MAQYLETINLENLNILELGAAAALPSIICALNNARCVVASDYPDNNLIENIQKNAQTNIPQLVERGVFFAIPYLWGSDPKLLIDCIHVDDAPGKTDANKKFDVILMVP